jgi:hypothetical protein
VEAQPRNWRRNGAFTLMKGEKKIFKQACFYFDKFTLIYLLIERFWRLFSDDWMNALGQSKSLLFCVGYCGPTLNSPFRLLWSSIFLHIFEFILRLYLFWCQWVDILYYCPTRMGFQMPRAWSTNRDLRCVKLFTWPA